METLVETNKETFFSRKKTDVFLNFSRSVFVRRLAMAAKFKKNIQDFFRRIFVRT